MLKAEHEMSFLGMLLSANVGVHLPDSTVGQVHDDSLLFKCLHSL